MSADNSSKEILALIPARGGSKGIPRKNVRVVAGLPLVAHSIRAARETPAITRVVVSTDDAEVERVARDWGAEVIWRPPEISGDTASSESALLHALIELRSEEGYSPELVVFLQPTSPLRRLDDVQNAVEALTTAEADSLFSACEQHAFVWRRQDGVVDSFTYDYRTRPRRQDAPEFLMENGSIYVFKPWVLEQLGNRLGGRIAVYPMSIYDSFQIDERDDLDVMEALFAFRETDWAAVPDLSSIELLAMDFDGVMTDNRVLTDQEGREAVWAHRSDGWGIARLREAGVQIIVISAEVNPVVEARCRKLKIDCLQGCPDKLSALKEVADQRGLAASTIAYMGNDVNDLDCLKWAGAAFAVADAVPAVRTVANYVTEAPGGRGAVREVCDLVLAQKQKRSGDG
jgi:YrbI family 3-deoxy-D-manno-octulosonate 8-phosphate phosphatase